MAENAEPNTIPAPDERPLVARTSPLEERWGRLSIVFGQDGVCSLAGKKVLLFGLGGVGSNCLEALARGGVGSFVLVDCDVVQPSNVNRQAVAWERTIGRRKTDVAREMVRGINPAAQVEVIDEFVLAENLSAFLDAHGDVDFVIDAIDTVSAKLSLAKLCEDRDLPLVCSAGAADRFFPERLAFANVYDTHDCGLCRILRKEARKLGIKRWTILYSDEPSARELLGTSRLPEPEQVPGERRRKLPLGTTSWMPPIMGQMIAGYAICSLLGLENGGRSL